MRRLIAYSSSRRAAIWLSRSRSRRSSINSERLIPGCPVRLFELLSARQLDPDVPKMMKRIGGVKKIMGAELPRLSRQRGSGLNGERAVPRWPKLLLWPSRKRRTFRIGPSLQDDEVVPARSTKPSTFYVDEHVIGALVSGVSLFVREMPAWVLDLADYLLRWTVEANNEPPDEQDGLDRENRPYYWNARFFGFLGAIVFPRSIRREPHALSRTDD